MTVEIRAATEADVEELTTRLRTGRPDMAAIWAGVRGSREVFVGLINGEPAAIWGIVGGTLLSNQAYIWLLTGEAVDRFPLAFLRHSRALTTSLQSRFGRLYCFVLADYRCSVRWLEWLGFSCYGQEEVAGQVIKFYEKGA